jgi:glycine oxidase
VSAPDCADVVIVGGGVIGLSVGWRAARAGLAVTVFDPAPGRGASWAAAGMLAPVTEAHPAEAPLAVLGMASLRRWAGFADDLAEDSGADVGLRRDGTLVVAVDADDRLALVEQEAAQRQMGLHSVRCTPAQCRQLEPLLSPRLHGGLRVDGDWQVDNRALLGALAVGLSKRGGRLVTTSVRRLLTDADAVVGVELDGGEVLSAEAVVVAAGVDSRALEGIPVEARPPVRPVKGEILRLQADPSRLVINRTVRASVHGTPVYIVGRCHGEIVVGATMQEGGFETTVRAGAVSDLLGAAIEVIPALEELPLVEMCARLRPATPDNAPVLGPTPVPGLVFATGHHRNGMLLAPITADAVVSILRGDPLPAEAQPFTLARFA